MINAQAKVSAFDSLLLQFSYVCFDLKIYFGSLTNNNIHRYAREYVRLRKKTDAVYTIFEFEVNGVSILMINDAINGDRPAKFFTMECFLKKIGKYRSEMCFDEDIDRFSISDNNLNPKKNNIIKSFVDEVEKNPDYWTKVFQ